MQTDADRLSKQHTCFCTHEPPEQGEAAFIYIHMCVCVCVHAYTYINVNVYIYIYIYLCKLKCDADLSSLQLLCTMQSGAHRASFEDAHQHTHTHTHTHTQHRPKHTQERRRPAMLTCLHAHRLCLRKL